MEKIDEFLYGILKQNFTENSNSSCISNPDSRNFNFLCRSEDFIISFLTCQERFELEFPALNSFHRRIIHRLGRRYNLAHRVETTSPFNLNSKLRKIYLTKPVLELLEVSNESIAVPKTYIPPLLKCVDWLKESIQNGDQICIFSPEDSIIDDLVTKKTLKKKEKNKNLTLTLAPSAESIVVPVPKFKILKREVPKITPSTSSFSSSSNTVPVTNSSLLHISLENLSLEAREAKYQEARERIFEGFQSLAEDEDLDEFETVPVFATPKITGPTSYVSTESESDPFATNIYDGTSNTEIDFDETLNDTSISLSSPSSCTLNPEAVPFTFTAFIDKDLISTSEFYPLPIDTGYNNSNGSQSQLRYFQAPSLSIQIDHIYTVKPKLKPSDVTSALLNYSDLQKILKLYSPAIIKTVQVPTNFAFLLSNCELNRAEEPWVIEKWVPEFYLD